MVLRKANAPLVETPREGAMIRRRLDLLTRILEGRLQLLLSGRLLIEYKQQLRSPRNDHVRALFEIIDRADRVVWNWRKPWSGAERDKASRCRFPQEDQHVLRTAVRDTTTTIYTEERRMLRVDDCIHRSFRVHINAP